MYNNDIKETLKKLHKTLNPPIPTYVYIREYGSRAPYRLRFEYKPYRWQKAFINDARCQGFSVSFWHPPK